MRGRRLACCGVALILLAGCAGPLPRHMWTGDASAMALMAQRDGTIRTLSATCRMLLDGGDGKVELSGVIVASPPNCLRVRAWKFSHAVLDVTMNPDGVYMFAKELETPSAAEALRVTHRELADATALLPGFSVDAEWRIGDVGSTSFTRNRAINDETGVMVCVVDKDTLTTTRCEFRAAAGEVHQSLTFTDYRMIDDVPWPMRVCGSGRGGSFVILFDDVHLNAALPSNAFEPPRRAVKQP